MPKPRKSSSDGSCRDSEGESGTHGASESADDFSENRSNRRSAASGSSTPPGTRSNSSDSDDDSVSSRTQDSPRGFVADYDSGRSSAPTSASRRTGCSSQRDRSDGSTSSTSSSEDDSGVGNGNTLKSRMKTLFTRQENKEAEAEAEELGELHDR